MRAFGFGAHGIARRTVRTSTAPALTALSLSAVQIVENSASGTVVGGVLGKTAGSTLSLADDAGGRFALSGANLVAGLTATDYEAATGHSITIRETLAGATNSPRDTSLTLTVINVNEAADLSALGLSSTSFAIGTAASGAITGVTPGSSIAAIGLPSGFTIDGPARTWTWSGAGSAASTTITLIETLADSANSPRVSDVGVTVTAANPVILAVLAGQSNMEGRETADRAGVDLDVAKVAQFVGDPAVANYRTLSSDITPLLHFASSTDADAAGTLGPGEYAARQLLADNPSADVVLVPVARGSTSLVGGPWLSNATPGDGGYLFENMIDQTNRACAAAQTAYPGRLVRVLLFWSQGEFDAANGTSRVQYRDALNDLITRFRARVSGAASASVVIGSMIPEKWHFTSPNYEAAYGAINAAQVDLSLIVAGVRYAMGPVYTGGARDFLHYQPAQRVRDYGLAMGAALSDASGPSVTSSAENGSYVGNALAYPLTGDDAHMTFHINGGADAAQFEISDPYLNPTLRWADDGPGPAAGDYVVGVRGRDGAGNFGPTKTITWRVAPAYGSGGDGAPAAVQTSAKALDAGFAPSPYPVPAVSFGAGLNLIHIYATGSITGLTGVSVNGVAAAKLAGSPSGDTSQVWAIPFAVAITASLTLTFAGSASTIRIEVVTLTNTAAAPASTAVLDFGYRNTPHDTAPLTCPPGGLIVALGRNGTGAAVAADTGNVMLFSDAANGQVALTRTTTGPAGFTGDGGYSALVAMAFAAWA